MPLYRFKCALCNKSWEAYRTREHPDKDYCCGVEAGLERGVEPQAMALETFEDGPALQLREIKGRD